MQHEEEIDHNFNENISLSEETTKPIWLEPMSHRSEDFGNVNDLKKLFRSSKSSETDDTNYEKKKKKSQTEEQVKEEAAMVALLKSEKIVPVNSGTFLKTQSQLFDIEEKYLHINDFPSEAIEKAAITFDTNNMMSENLSDYRYDRVKGQSTRRYWNTVKAVWEERIQEEEEEKSLNGKTELEVDSKRKEKSRKEDGGLFNFGFSGQVDEENSFNMNLYEDENEEESHKKKEEKEKEDEEEEQNFQFILEKILDPNNKHTFEDEEEEVPKRKEGDNQELLEFLSSHLSSIKIPKPPEEKIDDSQFSNLIDSKILDFKENLFE